MPPYEYIKGYDDIGQQMFNMLEPSIDKLRYQIICYLKSRNKNADYTTVKTALFCNNSESYIEVNIENIKTECAEILRAYVEDLTNMKTTIFYGSLMNNFMLIITDSKLDTLYEKLLNKRRTYTVKWDINNVTKAINIPKDFTIPFIELD